MDGTIHLMAEWLYREAGRLIEPDPELWLKVVNPELWEPLGTFSANLERARAFWRAQPYVIEHATVNVCRLLQATWQLTGKPFLPSEDDAIAQEVRARITADFERRYAETGSKDVAAGYDFERALDRYELFLKADYDFEREVFGVFLSQIVATWTAFEALAADLWSAVLDVDSQAVVARAAHSFQSLEKIQKAYAALLPRSHEIDVILTQIELRKLNLVRNVALHRGGITDQKYLDYCAQINWSVPDELKKPLVLDGARVRDVLNPAIQAGIDLIGAVDRWLTAERPPKR